MEMQKKENDGIGYVRKEDYEYEGKRYEADIKNGDKVVIKDEGRIEESQWGEQHKFLISTRNGDKRASFNQASINILIDAYGKDSRDWVGKEVNVLTRKAVIANNKVIVAYFVTDGWNLDDYGDLMSGIKDENTTEYPEGKDEGIDSERVPF